MHEMLIVASFWQSYLQALPQPSVSPPSSITQQKNPAYFSEILSRRERHRQFFYDVARSKDDPESSEKEEPKTIVIFAPHPDDEILCCSRTIAQRLQQGDRVKIIYVTDGDGLQEVLPARAQTYGRSRRTESRVATRVLGLEQSDLFFLNFPDRQLSDLMENENVRSQYTGQTYTNHDSAFPHTPYRLSLLQKNIDRLLSRLEPDEVYIPSQIDEHPDHRVTAQIVHNILSLREKKPDIYEYIVHGKTFPDQEIASRDPLKLKLIRFFRSQFHDRSHREFLEQFASTEEAFQRVGAEIVKKQ